MKRWKVYVNFYARYLLLIWSKVICIVSAQNNASTNQVFYCLKKKNGYTLTPNLETIYAIQWHINTDDSNCLFLANVIMCTKILFSREKTMSTLAVSLKKRLKIER